MPIAFTLVGLFLIGIVVLDVFQTLFHPAGRGALSDWIAQAVWKTFRRFANRYRGILTYAGPVALALIIVSWVSFTLFGFALVYLPHVAAQFVFDAGVNPAHHFGFWEAMSDSIGALITVSQGINPKSEWLALLRGFEALIGFGLLTASVSWLLSIYPVLESRRALAQRAALLHNAELENHIDLIADCGERSGDWIMGMAADLANLRNQMAQFPISFYFYVGEPQTALAGALPYLYEISDRAFQSNDPVVRLAGTALGGAVEDFLDVLAEVFLRIPSDDKKAVLRIYAFEQMSDMMLLERPTPYPRSKAS
jgi:hypothetical protein